jgi:hypothetical protein
MIRMGLSLQIIVGNVCEIGFDAIQTLLIVIGGL